MLDNDVRRKKKLLVLAILLSLALGGWGAILMIGCKARLTSLEYHTNLAYKEIKADYAIHDNHLNLQGENICRQKIVSQLREDDRSQVTEEMVKDKMTSCYQKFQEFNNLKF